MRFLALIVFASSLSAQITLPQYKGVLAAGGPQPFTYYVDSAAGLDTNPGTLAQPWQTIAKMNTATLTPGQSVGFKRGGLWREILAPNNSGTAGSPITYGAYGTGGNPVISGANLKNSGWSQAAPILHADAFTGIDGTELHAYNAGWNYLGSTGLNSGTGTMAIHGNAAQAVTSGQQLFYYWNGAFGDGQYSQMKLTTTNNDYIGPAVRLNGTTKGNTSGFRCWGNPTDKLGLDRITSGSTVSVGTYGTFSTGDIVRLEASGTSITCKVNGITRISYTEVGGYSGGSGGISGTYFTSAGTIDDVEVGNLGGVSTTWQSSVTTQPKEVFFNGSKGVLVASAAAITAPNQWYWAANVLFVYSTSDPAIVFTTPGIEVSTRWIGIYSSQKYIHFSNLQAWGSNTHGIQLDGDVTGTTVDGVVSSYNWGSGISIFSSGNTSRTITGVVVSNSQFYYNGGDGVGGGPADTTVPATIYDGLRISNVIAHHNAQDPMDNAFTAGIHLGSPATYAAAYLYSMRNCLVENSTSYSNGRSTAGAYIAGANSGLGAWLDTTLACEVRYSQFYDNALNGFSSENGTANKIHHNVTWGHTNTNPGWYLGAGGINVGASRKDLISDSNLIAHNTSWNDAYCYASSGNNPGTEVVKGNIWRNNICFAPTVASLAAVAGAQNAHAADGWGSGNVYEYNALGVAGAGFILWGTGNSISTYAAFETAYGTVTHSVAGDPLFTNPAVFDFTLQTGSPAIGAGVFIPGVSTANPPNIGAK